MEYGDMSVLIGRMMSLTRVTELGIESMRNSLYTLFMEHITSSQISKLYCQQPKQEYGGHCATVGEEGLGAE